MRRRITWIFALFTAALGVALLVGYFAQRQPVVLLHHRSSAGVHDFLVADRGSLFLARQSCAVPAGSTGDTSQFGQFTVSLNTTTASTPITISANSLSITGSQITMTADLLTPNIKHGFVWLNLNGPVTAPPMGTLQLTCRAAGAPMWVLGLPLVLPLTFLLVRTRRRSRRLSAGLCTQCGYDLRASPQRCPECGAIAPIVGM